MLKNIIVNNATLSFIQDDITKQNVDAIVNAANSSLMGGGGVDGAIHRAGGPEILEECKRIVVEIGRLPAGDAVMTTGGNLPAKYVIHTVGPIWGGGKRSEATVLRNCYINSLKLAEDKGIKTIAFPSISTGAYRYPLNDAAKIAVSAVREFLESSNGITEVRFVLFDTVTYEAYSACVDQ